MVELELKSGLGLELDGVRAGVGVGGGGEVGSGGRGGVGIVS